jgi:pimeloyl-ACP methyl ester carboxylesterase
VACIPPREPTSGADLPKIDVPVLVIQGDADRILPLPRPASGYPA